MPSDVAVERPDTGVVSVDLDDNVAWHGVADSDRQDLYVSSLRVRGVDNGAVPDSGSLSQYVHVVPVHMHGMDASAGVVVDDDADGVAGAEVVNVRFSWEVLFAKLGFEKQRVVVVSAEGGIVHEEKIVGAIGLVGDCDFLDGLWVWSGRNAEERNGLVQAVAVAVQDLAVWNRRSGVWKRTLVCILVCKDISTCGKKGCTILHLQ